MNSIVGVLCSAWCLSSPNTIQMIPWETSRYSSSSLSGPRWCPRRLPGDCLICLGQRIWQQHDGFVDRVCCATTLLWPSRLNIPRTVSLMVPFELGFQWGTLRRQQDQQDRAQICVNGYHRHVDLASLSTPTLHVQRGPWEPSHWPELLPLDTPRLANGLYGHTETTGIRWGGSW
jgi:hypothetical protein